MAEKQQDQGMTGHDAPHTVSVSAEVNAPPMTVLWSQAGSMIAVPEEDVARWLADGWSTKTFDLETLKDNARALYKAIGPAMTDYLAAVVQYGYHSPESDAEVAVAQQAVRDFGEAWARLSVALAARYPTKEPEPIVVNEGGVEIQVDPNQVDPEKRPRAVEDITEEAELNQQPAALRARTVTRLKRDPKNHAALLKAGAIGPLEAAPEAESGQEDS